ncbi:MAG: DUF523 domain-containing protein [Candidatus Eisenbacteria bacterium]|nr:DUF523 domain-containing protein [Candidatus Eisenbacteria bacterium]
MRAISACLIGIRCRYDGSDNLHPQALWMMRDEGLLPLCPEQLGGLPTPRTPAEIVGGDGADVLAGRAQVLDREGRDVTAYYVRGAQETARICQRLGITEMLLKQRSPSCGAGCIYHGEALVAGDGVTAARLRRSGIRATAHPDPPARGARGDR